MSNSPRLLIVEDEGPMRMALQDCLNAEGYRTLTANNGESGLERALREKPDLILLDIMMPTLDGFGVCQELRRRGYRHPILILTAKGRVEDRVLGLDLGADDYLAKPFSTDELLARVRALLRRIQRGQEATPSKLVLGDLVIDFQAQIANRGQSPVRFTAKEFAMLQLLAEARGAAISRERFLDVVWQYGAFPTTRTVDNHIASLRSKVECKPENPRWILTVHGIGYRLAQTDLTNS
jgi:DNA-binding response OmpR family regulator